MMKRVFPILLLVLLLCATVSAFGLEQTCSPWAAPYIERADALGLLPESMRNADLRASISREEFAELSVRLSEKLDGVKADEPQVSPFSDCDNPQIAKAAMLGITDGVSEGIFAPQSLLTREQGAAMLARVYKKHAMPGWTLESDDEYKSRFMNSFVTPMQFADAYEFSSWAFTDISFMRARSIIDGVGDNRFDSKGSLTREQAVKIAVKMLAVTDNPDFAPMDARIVDCPEGDALFIWFENGSTVIALFDTDGVLIRKYCSEPVNTELFQQLEAARYSADGWYSGLAGLFKIEDHDLIRVSGMPVKDMVFVNTGAVSPVLVFLTWEDKGSIQGLGMPADTILSLSESGGETILLSASDRHGIGIAGLETMDSDIIFYSLDDVGMMHFDSYRYVLASGAGGEEVLGPGVRDIRPVDFTAGRPEVMDGFSWDDPEGYKHIYLERETERLRDLSLCR